jgi:sugar/nucleoside kinase (ribokinase family)
VPRYDYTTVGHVTCDVLPDELIEQEGPGSPVSDWLRHPLGRPGGTALYSALQAARLGLRTHILTSGDHVEIERLLGPLRAEVALTVLPAPHTTTLLTCGEGAARHQRLLAWAGALTPPAVDTAILHLAPVARETPRTWSGRADLVGLTPQGLVREWDAAGEVALAPLHYELVPARCDAWALSEREHERCAPQLAHVVAAGTVVAVTDGAQPTTLHLPDGTREHVPVPPVAAPREDLGAGDVWAAAFFVALHEGRPPAQAAAFATAAAAVRLAGVGPGAIGDRAAVEARLKGSRP